MKPENILFGEDGYLLLDNFSYCRKIEGDQNVIKSFCGTPEYLAPEMIAQTGHD